MLAMDVEGNDNEFAQFILMHIQHRLKTDQLNIFEKCLLVEFCLLKGDKAHQEKARALAATIIDDQNQLEKVHEQYKNGNIRLQIFEAVLNSSSLEAPKVDLSAYADLNQQPYGSDDDDSYGGGHAYGGGAGSSNRRAAPQQQRLMRGGPPPDM